MTVDIFTSEKNIKKDKKTHSFEYVTEFNMENPDIQNNIKDNPEEFEIHKHCFYDNILIKLR